MIHGWIVSNRHHRTKVSKWVLVCRFISFVRNSLESRTNISSRFSWSSGTATCNKGNNSIFIGNCCLHLAHFINTQLNIKLTLWHQCTNSSRDPDFAIKTEAKYAIHGRSVNCGTNIQRNDIGFENCSSIITLPSHLNTNSKSGSNRIIFI